MVFIGPDPVGVGPCLERPAQRGQPTWPPNDYHGVYHETLGRDPTCNIPYYVRSGDTDINLESRTACEDLADCRSNTGRESPEQQLPAPTHIRHLVMRNGEVRGGQLQCNPLISKYYRGSFVGRTAHIMGFTAL